MCEVLVHPSVSTDTQRVIELQQRTGRLVVLSNSGSTVKLVANRQQRLADAYQPGPNSAA